MRIGPAVLTSSPNRSENFLGRYLSTHMAVDFDVVLVLGCAAESYCFCNLRSVAVDWKIQVNVLDGHLSRFQLLHLDQEVMDGLTQEA